MQMPGHVLGRRPFHPTCCISAMIVLLPVSPVIAVVTQRACYPRRLCSSANHCGGRPRYQNRTKIANHGDADGENATLRSQTPLIKSTFLDRLRTDGSMSAMENSLGGEVEKTQVHSHEGLCLIQSNISVIHCNCYLAKGFVRPST